MPSSTGKEASDHDDQDDDDDDDDQNDDDDEAGRKRCLCSDLSFVTALLRFALASRGFVKYDIEDKKSEKKTEKAKQRRVGFRHWFVAKLKSVEKS